MKVVTLNGSECQLQFTKDELLLLDALAPSYSLDGRFSLAELEAAVEAVDVKVFQVAGKMLHEWSHGVAHQDLHADLSAVLVHMRARGVAA